MKQGGKQAAAGFTIVETMIVLAVTSVLFVSAVMAINGRQNKTEFLTSINNIQQQIQQIINETSTGYYPNNGNFDCTPQTGQPPTFTNGSSQQGTNQGCVFLGKAIQFQVKNTDPEQFIVYPIAGNRLDIVKREASTLYGATGTWPVAIAQGTGLNFALNNDMTAQGILQFGLNTVYMNYVSNSGVSSPTGAVAFLSSLASYTASCNGVCSGSQHYGLYAVSGSVGLGATRGDMVDAMDKLYVSPTSTPFVPANSVQICFASGTTNQSGLVTIGGGGSLTVTLAVRDGKTC